MLPTSPSRAPAVRPLFASPRGPGGRAGLTRPSRAGGDAEDAADSARRGWRAACRAWRRGAVIMGRRTFDVGVGPWGENPTFHALCFIVSHNARDTIMKHGGTSCVFVPDGIERRRSGWTLSVRPSPTGAPPPVPEGVPLRLAPRPR
jgi:hypothetical protein